MSSVRFATILSLIFAIPLAWADFTREDLDRALKDHIAGKSHRYVAPNELNPMDALPLVQDAPSGAIVSVGTERGFVDLTLAKNATGLVLADVDSGVVLFNRINIALLKAAESRSDYIHLRLNASSTVWKERLSRVLKGDQLGILSGRENEIWEWWQANVAKNPDFDEYHRPTVSSFRETSYIHRDDHFDRVSSIAKADRVSAHTADLNFPQQLVGVLKKLKVKIALFDYSNAWFPHFVSPERTNALINALRPFTDPRSVFLITHQSEGPKVGNALTWSFAGFRFEAFPNSDSWLAYYNSMFSEEPSSLPFAHRYVHGKEIADEMKPAMARIAHGKSYEQVIRDPVRTLAWLKAGRELLEGPADALYIELARDFATLQSSETPSSDRFRLVRKWLDSPEKTLVVPGPDYLSSESKILKIAQVFGKPVLFNLAAEGASVEAQLLLSLLRPEESAPFLEELAKTPETRTRLIRTVASPLQSRSVVGRQLLAKPEPSLIAAVKESLLRGSDVRAYAVLLRDERIDVRTGVAQLLNAAIPDENLAQVFEKMPWDASPTSYLGVISALDLEKRPAAREFFKSSLIGSLELVRDETMRTKLNRFLVERLGEAAASCIGRETAVH